MLPAESRSIEGAAGELAALLERLETWIVGQRHSWSGS